MDERNPVNLQKVLGRDAKPSEMIFLLDGSAARLRFEYDRNTSVTFEFTEGRDVRDSHGWRDTVTARIEVYSPSTGEWYEVCSGLATCHPNDNFDVQVGRKVAISNMLHDARMDRHDRLTVWRVYHGRTGKNAYGELYLRPTARRIALHESKVRSAAHAVAVEG